MHRATRRGLAAVAIVAGIVATVPGTVQASTQCGVVVCVEAVASASWSCQTTDNAIPGYDLIQCAGVARPEARGYSDLSVPGSLTSSGSTEGKYIYPSITYPITGPATPPSTCTWAGLGEDSCGSAGTALTIGTGAYVPFGACLDTYFGFDAEVTATVTGTASKTLPLVLPTVDSATATETSSAKLSGVPVSERCAFA